MRKGTYCSYRECCASREEEVTWNIAEHYTVQIERRVMEKKKLYG